MSFARLAMSLLTRGLIGTRLSFLYLISNGRRHDVQEEHRRHFRDVRRIDGV
jgi:hypothetical protein